MMDPTGAKWESANPCAPQAFFGLLWEQLCGGSTLDSWQFRAMNVQALLREAIEISAVARDFRPLQPALLDVFAEAIQAGRRDPVLEQFRVATSALEDPRLKEQTPAALSHAEHTALHLLDTLRGYPILLRNEVERLLVDTAVQEKKQIVLVANALGTELLNRGFSRAFLHSFAERLVFEPFAEVIAKLLGLLDRPALTFRCIVPVNWPAFLDDILLAQGAVHSTLPDIGSSKEVSDFRANNPPSNYRFFITEVEARDQHAAAQAAALRAAQVMNLAVFYLPNKKLEVPRRTTLVLEGSSAYLVDPDLSHESYIQDSGRASNKLRKASSRAMELMSAPLQYHALGVLATAPESRLTNFWVSFEALLVDHDGSIIDKITNYIPTSLALSYSGRLLRANAIELARFIHAGGSNGLPAAAELRKLFHLTPKGKVFIDPAVLTDLLVDDTAASKLFGLCARNPLLIFRLNQMREMIRSHGNLKKAVEAHRRGVGWQLSRIYRARNSLFPPRPSAPPSRATRAAPSHLRLDDVALPGARDRRQHLTHRGFGAREATCAIRYLPLEDRKPYPHQQEPHERGDVLDPQQRRSTLAIRPHPSCVFSCITDARLAWQVTATDRCREATDDESGKAFSSD